MAAQGNEAVLEHLDKAIEASEAAGMSTSEMIGILFYYAHNLAQHARDIALAQSAEGGSEEG